MRGSRNRNERVAPRSPQPETSLHDNEDPAQPRINKYIQFKKKLIIKKIRMLNEMASKATFVSNIPKIW